MREVGITKPLEITPSLKLSIYSVSLGHRQRIVPPTESDQRQRRDGAGNGSNKNRCCRRPSQLGRCTLSTTQPRRNPLLARMGNREDKSISDLKEEIFHKFRDFMTGITKIDELGTAGSRLLSGFQQAFEFIRKPPIDTNSKLVKKIIVANETERLKSYINSGCSKPNDIVQNATNLRSCKNGLLHQISEAKAVLNELEDLLADVTNAIQSIYGNLSDFADLDFDVKLDEQATYDDLEENTAFSHSQSTDITTTKIKENIDVTHLTALMAIIYSMVKQDYLMQERIVSALDLKLSSEELESYCKMWSLHPFIDDEVMHQAWEYIH